jgi:hypothetical protein
LDGGNRERPWGDEASLSEIEANQAALRECELAENFEQSPRAATRR